MSRADQVFVARFSLGLVSLVAGLAVMGYLTRAQLQTSGPQGSSPSAALQAARDVMPLVDLQRAIAALEQSAAAAGTYEGADLSSLRGIRLVRVDAASYCVEADAGEALVHVAGPAGSPEPGSC